MCTATKFKKYSTTLQHGSPGVKFSVRVLEDAFTEPDYESRRE
jgi:hypothetical protein